MDGGGHDLGEGEGEVALARPSERNRIYNFQPITHGSFGKLKIR